MISILDRYIGRTLLSTTFLSLLILLSVFLFFALVDELNDAGRGNYGVLQALQYILLTIPRLTYDLFPIAAVVGGMSTLGILANNSELVVMRTSGISQSRLALSFVKTGILLILFNMIIGEFVAPVSEQKAKQLRSVALTNQITLKTKNGFWLRNGNSFINIKKILPGDKVENVYIYEFDDNGYLRTSIRAATGEYVDDKWILRNIAQTKISDDSAESSFVETATWDVILNPEVINIVTIKPQYLSMLGLLDYITYLKRNGQNSKLYEQALWSKIINPASIIIMLLLAIPIVKIGSRTVSLGQRVFVGALIGIVYHIVNQISGNLGIVYGFMPFISVSLPSLILLAFIIHKLRQSHS